METIDSRRKEQVEPTMPFVEWCVHPLRERPVTAGWVIGFLLVLHGAIYFFFHQIWYVILAAAVLLPSLASFFLPVRYALYASHITVTTQFHRVSRSWDEFQRCEVDSRGVFLSPFERPSRLDNFRGLYLRFGTQREAVLDYLRRRPEHWSPC